VTEIPKGWARNAAKLLRQPDPGPTSFLVDELLVEESIFGIGGQWKVGKTWLALELILATTGARPAFGRYRAQQPGPVLAVFEESGQVALVRRFRALRKGYEIDNRRFDRALSKLRVAANVGVRLTDPAWQQTLLHAARPGRFRLILFDPFVRMKGDADENRQVEIAPALDFLRELREHSGAAVGFVHHSGYEGTHFRGTSDLEGYWESKLTIAGKPGSGGPFTLRAEHREAETTAELKYRVSGSNEGRWVRLVPTTSVSVEEHRRDEVHAFVEEKPGHTGVEIATALKRNRAAVADDLKRLKQEGLVFFSQPGSPEYPSGEVGEDGRSHNRKEWFSCSRSPKRSSPDSSENTGELPSSPASPAPYGRGAGGRAGSARARKGDRA
jgi:hypothetical protein